MISEREWDEAEERGRICGLTEPRATAAYFHTDTGMITVELNRGFSVSFHKNRSQILHQASNEQLSEIDVSAPGTSVFFPKLDDGFTVEGMLRGRFGTRKWEREWADRNGIKLAENTLFSELPAVQAAA